MFVCGMVHEIHAEGVASAAERPVEVLPAAF